MARTITITAGAPALDIEPGTYEATLAAISEPRTIFPTTGANAGQEVEILDWTFVLDGGEEIRGTTSLSSGPKSKLFGWMTALLGGKAPEVGAALAWTDDGHVTLGGQQLDGRIVNATIGLNEGGWPKITALSAPPVKRSRPAPVAAAAEVEPF
jgi:hypothetical protein